MRKVLSGIFVGLLALAGIFAKVVFIDYSIVDSAEEAGIELFFDGIKAEKINVPEDQEAMVVQDAYKISFDGCDGEVCYSYFKAGPSPEAEKDYRIAANGFMTSCQMNVAGESNFLKMLTDFKPKSANADLYRDTLYECKGKPFGKDYKYLRVIMLDKRDKGCVVVSYLCDDLKFFAREGDYYYFADPDREFNVKGMTVRFKE